MIPLKRVNWKRRKQVAAYTTRYLDSGVHEVALYLRDNLILIETQGRDQVAVPVSEVDSMVPMEAIECIGAVSGIAAA